MIKVFAIRDVMASAYMAPFTFPARGQAIRAFADTVNDPKTLLNRHPDDYSLYELGEFDEESGVLIGLDAPEFVVHARDMVEEKDTSQFEMFNEDGNDG